MVKVLVVNKNSSGKTMAGESPLSFALSPESHEFGLRQVFWLVPAFLRLPDRILSVTFWRKRKMELTATGIAADSHSVPY